MSFSLPLIAVPPPAVSGAGGQAAPDAASASAASGFGAVLAALLGETPEAQGQAPVAPGAKAPAAAPAEATLPEAVAEGEDAEAMAAEAALLAAAAQTPPPVVPITVPASGGETTTDAVAATAGAPSSAATAEIEAALPLEPETLPPETIETAESPASAAETASTSAASAETVEAPAAAPKPAVNTPTGDLAAQNNERRPAAASVAAAPAAPAAITTPSAAPPPAPAQAAVATAAQPLMAAAVAASATSLKATQTADPVAAAAVEGEDQAPQGSAKAGEAKPNAFVEQAKASAFAAQPSPAPAPGAAKPEALALLATAAEPAARETAPTDIEVADTTANLDAPDQSNASTATSASATNLEARDAARVAATSATVADLAAQVSRKLQGRNTHFDIQLTPEGLGRVDVRVDIDAQGKLTAAMAFDNPHAAAELRGRAGDLQRALEQAGFDISGGLSFQSPQDGQGGRQFADQAPDREAWQGRAFQNALGVADEAETAAVAARLYQQRRSPTGVDLRI
jgi:flagellar hook-length control protein FliK